MNPLRLGREVIYVEHGKLFGQTTTRTTTVCLLLLDTGKVSSPRGLNLTHHDPLLYIIPRDALLLSHLSSLGPEIVPLMYYRVLSTILPLHPQPPMTSFCARDLGLYNIFSPRRF